MAVGIIAQPIGNTPNKPNLKPKHSPSRGLEPKPSQNQEKEEQSERKKRKEDKGKELLHIMGQIRNLKKKTTSN